MCRDQACNGRRHRHFARVRSCPDREASRFEPGEKLDLATEVSLATEERFTALEQDATECGWLQTLAAAVEQPHAEPALQRGDAPRERGLRHVQSIRGPREVAKLRERQRVPEEPELDHDAKYVSR